ncbi:MAG: hypothetical protein K6G10_13105 [Butyrivibrio sp.]|nr:hypothetical protein [Butyrivibrio sp.]
MSKRIRNALTTVGAVIMAAAMIFALPQGAVRSYAAGAGPEVAVGVDVSKYQGGINWQQAKAAGVKFAMIRVGTTKKGLDEQFVNNINGANAAGVRTGIYIYSYATTPEAAAAEANQVLAWIAPYSVTFPIAIDIEDSCQKGLNSAQLQAIADTFCAIINANGYEPMVYSYRNWFQGRMPSVSSPKWIAQYSPTCDYPGEYAMWQSSSHGKYAGIPGRVDVNHLYVDYFSRIIPEGFNSWGGHVFYYHNYRKQYGWINLSGAKYHSDENGFIQTGWFQDESGIYYLDPNEGGLSKVGFADIDGARFYFDENGLRQSGLLHVGEGVYFATEDGICQKGLVQFPEGTRFFDENYAMRTGFTQIGDGVYYFDANGFMQTGMVKLETGTYYFGADGVMARGPVPLPDGTYYFDPADGHMVVGWLQQPDGWHFFDGNTGKMLVNVTAPLDNVNCTFDAAGVLVDPAGWTPGTPLPAPEAAAEASTTTP